MISLGLVMAGGAVGAGLRYMVSRLMLGLVGGGYPWGTLTVNILGGLAMGLLIGTLSRGPVPHPQAQLLLGVGVLGGFTTFSAFSLELVQMAERGALGVAAGYALLSV
ncbi:MAG: fluoride efflux transporter FluC, partial [Sphingomonas sp.]